MVASVPGAVASRSANGLDPPWQQCLSTSKGDARILIMRSGYLFCSLRLHLLELDVDAAGFGELVFEDDDAARGIECGAGGDEFVGACGDTQLIARVAAMPAFRSLRGEEFRGVEAAQKRLPYAEDLGGVAHAVGGVVFVVELAGQVAGGVLCRDGALLSSKVRRPRRKMRRGPGRTHLLN